MADIAASVLARLKNKAAASGRSYQLCLQLFCQEEFLRRLGKSQYAENLVLKGGLFIYSLTDFDSRVTVDVDFLLRRIPNTPEQLKTVLEEIIATPTVTTLSLLKLKMLPLLLLLKSLQESVHRRSPVLKILKHRSVLISVLGMSSCRDRKNGKSRHSFSILTPRQYIHTLLKQPLPRK